MGPGNVVPSRRVDGAGRLPVRCHDGPTRQVGAFIQVVVDEVLQQHLVHIRSMRGTSDGEHVVDQDPDRPMPRLHQCYHRRPKAELMQLRFEGEEYRIHGIGRLWHNLRGCRGNDPHRGPRPVLPGHGTAPV